MSNKEHEYKKLFISEADSNVEELETLLTQLEKSPADQKTIDSIFRITHTLKGNAAGMGFEVISKFAHALEDLFSEIKQSNIQIEEEIFTTLFKAVDTLKELVESLSDDKLNVRYRGIQRKLEVIVENGRKAEKPQEEAKASEKTAPKKAVAKTKKSSTKTKKEEKNQLEELQAQVEQHQANQPKKPMAVEEKKEILETLFKV